MHAERREILGKPLPQSAPISRKQQKRQFKRQEHASKGNAPDAECIMCKESHYLYGCQQFLDMNMIGRQNKVAELELCVRCLRSVHTGPCVNKRNNDACAKCLPEKKHHNSRLCPNWKPQANAAMKASKQQNKRKAKNGRHNGQAKRPRSANNQTRMHSAINKVGEWSSFSNAMASIPKQPKMGKFDKTVLLATMNIRLHEIKSDITVNCRSIADIGATLNSGKQSTHCEMPKTDFGS